MPTYILRNKEIAQRMVDYIKVVAGPAAAAGKPIVVEVGEYQTKRSSEQNRLLWALLTEIAEQVELEGKRFAKEAWYAHYLDLYAPKQEGPRGLVPVGSSQMTKEQFANFVTRIECHAVQELGVEFAAI
ncbi:recombination protein NinB [Burkholderia multivorans]|uniref:recombination protein NinB n=1 Tax=Burkholderia multivorans TaxID=87883 RepID=UPI001C259F1F|nr:recombination protein NinB [Burkholderia multivorans]MBU9534630.1 recombination protein NinB [Burkholderia multivorans]